MLYCKAIHSWVTIHSLESFGMFSCSPRLCSGQVLCFSWINRFL